MPTAPFPPHPHGRAQCIQSPLNQARKAEVKLQKPEVAVREGESRRTIQRLQPRTEGLLLAGTSEVPERFGLFGPGDSRGAAEQEKVYQAVRTAFLGGEAPPSEEAIQDDPMVERWEQMRADREQEDGTYLQRIMSGGAASDALS